MNSVMESPHRRRRHAKPREWVEDNTRQREFGREPGLVFQRHPRSTYGYVMTTAARTQHFIAVHVRDTVALRRNRFDADWDLAALGAQLTTMDYHGLTRLLRGDIAMNLHHLQDLTEHVGPTLLLITGVQRAVEAPTPWPPFPAEP